MKAGRKVYVPSSERKLPKLAPVWPIKPAPSTQTQTASDKSRATDKRPNP